MEVQIKKINDEAIIPAFAKAGDAGMDVFCNETVTLMPGQIVRVKTGIAMHIPEGCAGLFWDKSGLSMNHGLKTLGGVIDSGYRGEVLVGMINLGTEAYTIEKGNKVAQMIIQKVEHPEIREVEILADSERGESGFGSTGK
ncbi:MAG: dUTP diphosphatase [Patescibacteria group bacterium]